MKLFKKEGGLEATLLSVALGKMGVLIWMIQIGTPIRREIGLS